MFYALSDYRAKYSISVHNIIILWYTVNSSVIIGLYHLYFKYLHNISTSIYDHNLNCIDRERLRFVLHHIEFTPLEFIDWDSTVAALQSHLLIMPRIPKRAALNPRMYENRNLLVVHGMESILPGYWHCNLNILITYSTVRSVDWISRHFWHNAINANYYIIRYSSIKQRETLIKDKYLWVFERNGASIGFWDCFIIWLKPLISCALWNVR